MFKKIKGEEDLASMRQFFGPAGVDTMLREAVKMCWTIMPPERRSVEAVSQEIRRLIERILRDLKEDAKAFGFPKGT
jgi:hypothetical protein